jgi:hypothetical protein
VNMILPSEPTKEQVRTMLLYVELYLRNRGFKDLAKQACNLRDEIEECM